MFSLLFKIGTPACAPKRRGNSPGWSTGKPRQRKIRYPIVKKSFSRSQKHRKPAA